MVCAPTTDRKSTRLNSSHSLTSNAALFLPQRLQLLALKLPPPGGTLLALQLTVPLGALAEVGALSLTAALQPLAHPACSLLLAQLTTVLVACLFAVTTKLPALLRCVVSPL